MSTNREWWTCRLYDPAVDMAQKRDEDGCLVWKASADGSSQIAVLVSDTDRFLETRDPADLAFRDGMEPARFRLKPLTQRQLREHVNAADSIEEKYSRAFECAILRVDNWREMPDDPPRTLHVERRRDGVEMAKQESIDALMDAGVKQLDIWEIGCAAWVRATVPFGCGAALHAPRSSLTAAVAQRQRCQSADVTSHDSPKPDEPREPQPETTPPSS